MTDELTFVLSLAQPRSCSNCDAEQGIRWHVQAFQSSQTNHPRVSAYLGCDNCSETTSLIEFAEEQLEQAMAVADAAPVLALLRTWEALMPLMQPRTLAEMGEGDEPDLSALRALLGTMPEGLLQQLGVVTSELSAEAHRARNAKLTEMMQRAKEIIEKSR